MTAVSIQAESAPANPTQSEILYRAWRYAKAQWDLADYDPANPEGLSDAEGNEYCGRTCDALNAYLLHPSNGAMEFAQKMRVFRDEEIFDSWTRAPEIVRQLVKDAEQLAGWGDSE